MPSSTSTLILAAAVALASAISFAAFGRSKSVNKSTKIAGDTFTAAVFQDIRAEMREHGHMAPYDVLIGISDETTVRGLTGFVPVAQQQVAYGTSVSLATFQAEDDERSGSYYIGIIEDCRVRVVPGMPQYYGFGYKTYGMNNPRNPLRVRL